MNDAPAKARFTAARSPHCLNSLFAVVSIIFHAFLYLNQELLVLAHLDARTQILMRPFDSIKKN